ncbi:Wadjet anti-phage system protein JetA family protein [Hyalangium gracile]|uniref:Wadjet anti-phage system protein JetA family protein n=1 Tax=Hyalangium gracile TaxID=394092 RepID=UPI001CCF02AF|nr:Wadjet anti-phage system protein JetA family protein [Hyalangium gracile]
MSTTAIPDLFGRVPAALFAPLSGALAPLYWAILARYYQYEFEREPVALVKPAAIELAEQLLQASPAWQGRHEELLSLEEAGAPPEAEHGLEEGAITRTMARRLVSRLEATGWFHFEYRSTLGQVLSFHPWAARVLDTLVRVARDEQPIFQGYAHSIAILLKPDTFASRPGVSLREAHRHTLELVRELKILNRNIHAFTQRLLEEVTTASGVLEEGLDRYRQAVMANYHRLKTVENLYRWRSDILLRLDAIEHDAGSIAAAARWYAEQLALDLAAATRQVEEDLRLMRMRFETLPEITDDIDARNARFSGVALRKLMYLLRQDRRTEGQLQYLVEKLARDEAPELEFDVYRCELLRDGFLYTPPTRRAKAAPQKLPMRRRALSEAQRRQLAERLRSPYARARIEEFVSELLGARQAGTMEELPLRDDEDFVRAIHLVGYGLDGRGRYRFRPAEAPAAHVRGGAYGVPGGRFERSGKKG